MSMDKDTCLGYLPALGKSSASLGKGCVGIECGDQWLGVTSRKLQRLYKSYE